MLHHYQDHLHALSSNFLLWSIFCSSPTSLPWSALSHSHILLFFHVRLCRPTPQVEWKKKDGVLADTTGQVINFDRWLHFDNITLDDDGEYECKASNTHGSITRSFTVTVEGRPLSRAHRRSRCSADREDVISVLVWTLTCLCSSVWDDCESLLKNMCTCSQLQRSTSLININRSWSLFRVTAKCSTDKFWLWDLYFRV